MKTIKRILFMSLFAFVFSLNVIAACDDEAKKTDNWTKALSDCQTAMEANPNSNDARVFVIFYAQKLRLWDIAIDEQVKVIQIEAKNPANYLQTRFEDLARLLTSKGDYETARLAYLKAFEASDSVEKYIVFARALEANVKSGFKRNSEEKLDEKTIKADQKLVEQIADKSIAGKNEEALNEINQLISRRPSMPNAIAIRGIIYKSLSKNHEAVKDFETAVKLQPWESLFNFHLADVYTEINNREGCIEAASRVIANHDTMEGDAFKQRAFCKYRNGENQKAQEDYLQSGWLKDPNGSDSVSMAIAAYASANNCVITNYDDIESNFKKGNAHIVEKKFLCAVNFYETVIVNPKVNPYGKAMGQYNRAIAYMGLQKGSYAFSLQAARDFNRAVASGHLDAEVSSKANYYAGIMFWDIAASLVPGNATKIGLFELAFPKLEIGVNTSSAEEKPKRTVGLFSARCVYAKLLIKQITNEKAKNRTVEVTKLTEKLNKIVPQIEAECKTFGQVEAVKKLIETSYITFKNNYDSFRETK